MNDCSNPIRRPLRVITRLLCAANANIFPFPLTFGNQGGFDEHVSHVQKTNPYCVMYSLLFFTELIETGSIASTLLLLLLHLLRRLLLKEASVPQACEEFPRRVGQRCIMLFMGFEYYLLSLYCLPCRLLLFVVWTYVCIGVTFPKHLMGRKGWCSNRSLKRYTLWSVQHIYIC